MVYIKVSDGSETRKLQVTPGEVSFDQLRDRLATLFPKAVDEEGSHALSLQYRDADGDVITLSSDQELQLALSQLEEDSVWKVYIKNAQRRGHGGGGAQTCRRTCQRSQGQRNTCHGNSLFRHLFEPSVRRSGGLTDVWGDLEVQLQLVHDLQREIFSSGAGGGGGEAEKKPADVRKEPSGRASSSETTADALSHSTELPTVTESTDEAVKPKPRQEATPPSSDDGGKEKESSNAGEKSDCSSAAPQWQTRRFVAWEPRLRVGPLGFFHSHLTPVVYNVSFKSSSCCPATGGCGSASRGDETEEGESTDVGEETRRRGPDDDTSAEATKQ